MTTLSGFVQFAVAGDSEPSSGQTMSHKVARVLAAALAAEGWNVVMFERDGGYCLGASLGSEETT